MASETQRMMRNMDRAAREVSNSDTIYTETIWQGLSETERRSLRARLESIDITSRVGQYLDTDVYWLAVTSEDRQEAVEAMLRWSLSE